MNFQSHRWLDAFVVVVFTAFAIVFGSRELVDVDLGWHLVGGLWMFENASVLTIDPLGADGRFWLAYSWLPELVMAGVFRSWGFGGLQWMQTLGVVIGMWSLLVFLRVTNTKRAEQSEVVWRVSEVLSLGLLIIYAMPLWYLRPQFLSFLFFLVLIALAERKRLSLIFLLPLAIVWANVHLYWLAVPAVVMLYGVFLSAGKRRFKLTFFCAMVCGLAGFFTPYGIRQYFGIYEYLFQHDIGYQLIREFQPISSDLGMFFYAFVATLLLLLAFSRRLAHSENWPLLILILTFAVAALGKVKYAPLFGALAIIPINRTILPALLAGRLTEAPREHGAGVLTISSPKRGALIAVLLVVFFVLCADFFERPNPLTTRRRETIAYAKRIASEQPQAAHVLNHFDDGGWLALGLWLAKPEGAKESAIKTTIDGRTLVMGQKRLREFGVLQRMQDGWCEVVDSWGAEWAVLPLEMKLAERLELEDPMTSACLGGWEKLEQGEELALYRLISKSA